MLQLFQPISSAILEVATHLSEFQWYLCATLKYYEILTIVNTTQAVKKNCSPAGQIVILSNIITEHQNTKTKT